MHVPELSSKYWEKEENTKQGQKSAFKLHFSSQVSSESLCCPQTEHPQAWSSQLGGISSQEAMIK